MSRRFCSSIGSKFKGSILPPGTAYLFIYSQIHDNIYIQVYTCASGLDVGIAYICPLQLVRQFKYILTHIVMTGTVGHDFAS